MDQDLFFQQFLAAYTLSIAQGAQGLKTSLSATAKGTENVDWWLKTTCAGTPEHVWLDNRSLSTRWRTRELSVTKPPGEWRGRGGGAEPDLLSGRT